MTHFPTFAVSWAMQPQWLTVRADLDRGSVDRRGHREWKGGRQPQVGALSLKCALALTFCCESSWLRRENFCPLSTPLGSAEMERTSPEVAFGFVFWEIFNLLPRQTRRRLPVPKLCILREGAAPKFHSSPTTQLSGAGAIATLG